VGLVCGDAGGHDGHRIDRKFPAIGFATSALQPRRRARVESRRRQQAAYKPDQSWKLLAEAAYWEHLAEVEVSSHFEECNPAESKAPELRSAA
jgi:hypothetical protein